MISSSDILCEDCGSPMKQVYQFWQCTKCQRVDEHPVVLRLNAARRWAARILEAQDDS